MISGRGRPVAVDTVLQPSVVTIGDEWLFGINVV